MDFFLIKLSWFSKLSFKMASVSLTEVFITNVIVIFS